MSTKIGSKRVRTRCFFDISIDDKKAGRIVFELFDDVNPLTCENFRCLCTGERGVGKTTGKPLHYKGSRFHRVVKNFMIQGGDFSSNNGRGGECVWGSTFKDESFVKQHDQPFLLSMANRGKDTNGSQFFILTKPSPHLDGCHVVFGRVITGQDIVKEVEQLPIDSKSQPLKEVVISNCGELVPQLKNKSSADEKEKVQDKEIGKIKRKRRHSSSNSSASSDSSSSSSSNSSSSSTSDSSESDSSDSSELSSSDSDRHKKRHKLKKKKHHHNRHKSEKRQHSQERDDEKKKKKKKKGKDKKEKKDKKDKKKKESSKPVDDDNDQKLLNEIEKSAESIDKNKSVENENCSVRPEEVPEVPTNNFLRRDLPPKEEEAEKVVKEIVPKKTIVDDVFARREERRKNNGVLTSSGRKIKGRGSLRYRTPPPEDKHKDAARTGTETPPHWKSAQSRLKSIDQVMSRNRSNSDRNRRNGDDDFRSDRRRSSSNFRDDRQRRPLFRDDRQTGQAGFREEIDRTRRNRDDRYERNSERSSNRNGARDNRHHGNHREDNRESSRDLANRFVKSDMVQVGLSERKRHSDADEEEKKKKNGNLISNDGDHRREDGEVEDGEDQHKRSRERSSSSKHSSDKHRHVDRRSNELNARKELGKLSPSKDCRQEEKPIVYSSIRRRYSSSSYGSDSEDDSDKKAQHHRRY